MSKRVAKYQEECSKLPKAPVNIRLINIVLFCFNKYNFKSTIKEKLEGHAGILRQPLATESRILNHKGLDRLSREYCQYSLAYLVLVVTTLYEEIRKLLVKVNFIQRVLSKFHRRPVSFW